MTTEPFTVLIIGVDDDRSDALMLATVNPSSMTVLLTSIPRDSYVPIACYTNQKSDKINNSRVRGRQCTMDTVKQLLDVDIDFYFESNFHGIIEIVDALGGVTLTIRKNLSVRILRMNAVIRRYGCRRASIASMVNRRWRLPGNAIRTTPVISSGRAISSR